MGHKLTKEERLKQINENTREALIQLKEQEQEQERRIIINEKQAEISLQKGDQTSAVTHAHAIARSMQTKHALIQQSNHIQTIKQEVQMQQTMESVNQVMSDISELTDELYGKETKEEFDLRMKTYTTNRQELKERNELIAQHLSSGEPQIDISKILERLNDRVAIQTEALIPQIPITVMKQENIKKSYPQLQPTANVTCK